ncbi:hypothetical protein ACTJIJ_19505 [Niabella sp. 22666]|uniref:hypothetical protein n=1 Tax=Niabella sp. 22666 TaxID=3453954 RepID=UPI003F844F12
MTHYSLQLLVDTASCDELLEKTVDQQELLKAQQIELKADIKAFKTSLRDIGLELDRALNRLKISDEVIEKLEEGAVKDEYILNRTHQEYTVLVLKERQEKKTPQQLLLKELQLEKVMQELAIQKDFIAVISAHRIALQNLLPPDLNSKEPDSEARDDF